MIANWESTPHDSATWLYRLVFGEPTSTMFLAGPPSNPFVDKSIQAENLSALQRDADNVNSSLTLNRLLLQWTDTPTVVSAPTSESATLLDDEDADWRASLKANLSRLKEVDAEAEKHEPFDKYYSSDDDRASLHSFEDTGLGRGTRRRQSREWGRKNSPNAPDPMNDPYGRSHYGGPIPPYGGYPYPGYPPYAGVDPNGPGKAREWKEFFEESRKEEKALLLKNAEILQNLLESNQREEELRVRQRMEEAEARAKAEYEAAKRRALEMEAGEKEKAVKLAIAKEEAVKTKMNEEALTVKQEKEKTCIDISTSEDADVKRAIWDKTSLEIRFDQTKDAYQNSTSIRGTFFVFSKQTFRQRNVRSTHSERLEAVMDARHR
jgi:hypothetical protein